MRWFPSCQTSSIKECGLNHPQSCDNRRYTTPHLPFGPFLNRKRSTRRLCLSESVRKMGRWVLERGRLRICLRHLHPLLIQQEGERATECAKEVDIPQDERLTPTSDSEIRPLSYTSKGRRKKKEKEWFSKTELKLGRRVVKSKTMDAMRHMLPRLQLTVPMPIKMGKVGLTFETTLYFGTS